MSTTTTNASADAGANDSLSAKKERLRKLQKEVADKQETVDVLCTAKSTSDEDLCMALLSLKETKKENKNEEGGGASGETPSRFRQMSLQVMAPILTDEDQQKAAVLSAKAALGRKREEMEFLAEEIRVQEVVQKRSEEIDLESKLEDCRFVWDHSTMAIPVERLVPTRACPTFRAVGRKPAWNASESTDPQTLVRAHGMTSALSVDHPLMELPRRRQRKGCMIVPRTAMPRLNTYSPKITLRKAASKNISDMITMT